jgi:putative membrane protein
MHTARTLTVLVGGLVLGHAALAADLNKKDTEYLQKSAQGLMAEVKMGDMAQKQAADERVKQFGKRMVDDHGKDLQNLKQLASQKHVTLPDAPSKKQSKEADKLAKLSGADFDKEYVKYEMKDHKEDVEENGKTMKKAADPDVKQFASAEYQTVSAHKKDIDGIHSQLGK